MFHFSSKPVKKIDIELSDGDEIKFGSESLKVMHTPGHTTGSVTLIGGKHAFCGDTVFYESIGRTDLPTGNHQKLIESIHNQLMVLDDNIEVYPGHGRPTTIGHERQSNPYL